MTYYVIKTSNDKYLAYSWEEDHLEGSICVLRETELIYCHIFTLHSLNKFIDMLFNNKELEHKNEEFTLSHAETIKTTKFKNIDFLIKENKK